MAQPPGMTDSVLRRLEGYVSSHRDAGYDQGYIDGFRRYDNVRAWKTFSFLLLGLLGGVAIVWAGVTQGWIAASPPPAPDPVASGVDRGLRYKPAADFAKQSTVTVITRRMMHRMVLSQSSGSGFIFDRDGHILTNSHVIGEGANAFQVIWNDRLYDADLVGRSRTLDLAVLRFRARNIVPATLLEDGEEVHQAEEVIAVGSPFGLRHTVTMGIISYVGRKIDGETDVAYLQTDCAINRGNSGGPLVNLQGRVVGMNRMIVSRSGDNNGIGFAIPVHIVKKEADSIIAAAARNKKGPEEALLDDEGTPMVRAFMGINLSQERERGNGRTFIQIAHVVPFSSADHAGLRVGDVILSVDGVTIATVEEARQAISNRHPGDKVTLELLRDGEKLTISFNVGNSGD